MAEIASDDILASRYGGLHRSEKISATTANCPVGNCLVGNCPVAVVKLAVVELAIVLIPWEKCQNKHKIWILWQTALWSWNHFLYLSPSLFVRLIFPHLNRNPDQQKNFHREVFLPVACGGYLYLVFAVCDVTDWRHINVSKPTFWQSLLTQYAYSTRTLLILCIIALNINYQRSKWGYRRKIHSSLWHSSS